MKYIHSAYPNVIISPASSHSSKGELCSMKLVRFQDGDCFKENVSPFCSNQDELLTFRDADKRTFSLDPFILLASIP